MIGKRTLALTLILALAGLAIGSYCLAQPRADAPPTPPAAQPMPPCPMMPPGGANMEADKAGHFFQIQMAHQLQEAVFVPPMAGFMAIAAIKDDAPRKPEAIIKDLEDLLGKTKTLGFRNEIHFLLRDLYKAQGEVDKAMDQLRAVVAENDAAIQTQENKLSAK